MSHRTDNNASFVRKMIERNPRVTPEEIVTDSFGIIESTEEAQKLLEMARLELSLTGGFKPAVPADTLTASVEELGPATLNEIPAGDLSREDVGSFPTVIGKPVKWGELGKFDRRD